MGTFLRDRRRAFTRAIMHDDWKAARKYCRKYGIEIPENDQVFRAGIYKAAHECTDIPDYVKRAAATKCIQLGFKPFVDWSRRWTT